MAKAEFARATLSYDDTDYGIFDLTIDSNYSEIDVADTETTTGQSEFLGGKQVHTISFSTYKNAGSVDIMLNLVDEANTCVITIVSASAGDDTLYTGNLVLMNKSITGNIDGAVQMAYSGKITGALVESQP